MEMISRENESSLQNVITILSTTSQNSNFRELVLNDNLFSQITLSNTLIDSIFVYDTDNNLIYDGKTTKNAISFLSQEYVYAEYPKSFLTSPVTYINNKRILSPTLVFSLL